MSTGAIRKQTLQSNLDADSSHEHLALNASESAFDLAPKPKLVSIPENLDFRVLKGIHSKDDFDDMKPLQAALGSTENPEIPDEVDKPCSVIFVGSICSIKTYEEIKGISHK